MGAKVTRFIRAALFFVSGAAWIVALVLLLLRRVRFAVLSAAVALAADLTGRLWSRRAPIPMPYLMQWVLRLPRGPHAPQRFVRVLQPRSGERILEIGPGIGVHALPVAAALLPDGRLDVIDVQQEMLDQLAARAARRKLTNIVAAQGDAQALPYPNETFDAVYLISVLGETPDSAAVLREIHRVLKAEGRLVVSEVVVDPDFIPLASLRQRATDAGFTFDRSEGPSLAYSAVFRPRAR